MTESPLMIKSKEFALTVIKVCKELRNAKCESALINQFLRSGTSIGANIREAFCAHGKADFVAKLQIALKECSESEYWIELLIESGYYNDKELLNKCIEVKRILIASINTAKENNPQMDENFIIKIGTELEKEQMLKDYPYMQDVIRKDGYFLVAKNDDTIVGCLWAFKRDIPAPIEQNEIFINMIEVTHSNLRCKGIATAMLKEIIKIAKNENVYQVRAYCDIRNIPSHRLWLKNKFSISPVKMPDDTIAGSFVSCVL